ncbi:MAG: hypothetical protein A2X22_13910 [Bacteroidetes bacterium GWF2_49_14]|nr:MAG: hypothetical protein A2X22_13910 [Bacteroidetes bacterium GWF2_49_14]HBB91743.1 hypothetical protein [Bacteroidales bacterium]
MKIGSGISVFILLLGVITSGCSESVDVVMPGSSVPVIYGVLDINDTVHYIKLSKSFAGTDDPRTLASDPDKVFYKDATVFLRETSGSRKYTFTRMSGPERNEGYFPGLPNESYKLTGRLQSGFYELVVILPTEGDTLISSFHLMDTFQVLYPKPGFKRFYFYEDPTLFSWPDYNEAGLYELSLSFTYMEFLKSGEETIRTMHFSRQMDPEELEYEKTHFNYRFFSDPFFSFIATQVRRDEQVDYRKPVDLTIAITAADTTLSRYLKWFDLEIDDRINPNGNIPGAIGVVGSKNTVRYNGLIFSGRAQDSLIRGRYTRDLGFVANSEW